MLGDLRVKVSFFGDFFNVFAFVLHSVVLLVKGSAVFTDQLFL